MRACELIGTREDLPEVAWLFERIRDNVME